MKHECSAMLIHCIDFRFEPAIHEFLKQEGLSCDADILAVAGAAKNLIEAPESAEAKYIMKQIDISSELHHIKKVLVMHHMDCGAYGGHKAFESLDAEIATQKANMQKAGELIKAKHNHLEIIPVLAHIDDAGSVTFEKVDQIAATA